MTVSRSTIGVALLGSCGFACGALRADDLLDEALPCGSEEAFAFVEDCRALRSTGGACAGFATWAIESRGEYERFTLFLSRSSIEVGKFQYTGATPYFGLAQFVDHSRPGVLETGAYSLVNLGQRTGAAHPLPFRVGIANGSQSANLSLSEAGQGMINASSSTEIAGVFEGTFAYREDTQWSAFQTCFHIFEETAREL